MIIETKPSRRGYDLIVKTNDKEATISEDISTYVTSHDVVPDRYPEQFLEIAIEMMKFNCKSEYEIANWIIENVGDNIRREIADIHSDASEDD